MITVENSSRIRLIIADDHKLFREGVCTLLEAEAAIEIVAEARDGDEAVLFARTFNPDMMLLDIGMPGLNGIGATRLVKALNRDIKVLVLSNSEDEQSIAAAKEAGADAYIRKRIGIDDLLMVLFAIRDNEPFVSPYLSNFRLAGAPGESELPANHDFGLTERERTILGLLVEGYSNKEISKRIYVSLDTVKVHLKHIFEKLNVDSRTKAAVKTLRHNILPPPEVPVKTNSLEPTRMTAVAKASLNQSVFPHRRA
jgi:DNA-binding NarL/FixJ family response regulator